MIIYRLNIINNLKVNNLNEIEKGKTFHKIVKKKDFSVKNYQLLK